MKRCADVAVNEVVPIPRFRSPEWLQAFNDYAFDKRKFRKHELSEQIKAAQDAGAIGWLLWTRGTAIPPMLWPIWLANSSGTATSGSARSSRSGMKASPLL